MMVKYIFYFSYFLSYFTAALVVVSLRFPYIISKLIVYSIYIVNMFLLIYLLGKDELGKTENETVRALGGLLVIIGFFGLA
ncbi:hypothetical protein FVF72_07950 [Methanothermobacter sp. KEPCO-1]|uniref:Uncharacterized protein n=4 Tax=Methanothermobacter TaxID=145260 RepID=O26182_METTH|nr:hypothetical protein [Methanothermobacter thermautotrophicus]AAB84584.1 unknown [Methanothermobacter thermautotrophicus str. Delta H]NPV64736.1 hypothetical protein [Methanobacteriaceae archaeon]QEF95085.1 hypothetical protein FVF72_07950 [Methanothermobacter sp. KEPCO-1]RAO78444.1 hypothetical protein DPC56_08075 [Methanothermobacter tenebrarum]BAW31182.1 conserved hypothetical protein [Methanothermobacter sp. MT-2]BAZ98143.1 hypothetical protein tca_00068 [Methanothermobacter sp. EMTCatA